VIDRLHGQNLKLKQIIQEFQKELAVWRQPPRFSGLGYSSDEDEDVMDRLHGQNLKLKQIIQELQKERAAWQLVAWRLKQ